MTQKGLPIGIRLALVDVDLGNSIVSKGFAANLAFKVVYDKLFVRGVEPEPRCQRRGWRCWQRRRFTAHSVLRYFLGVIGVCLEGGGI
nr:hypothetical protein CFP56_49982 [Quercus suber]